ncbi:tyrosine-type recombinase/integrase [Nonomuraea roseoviolacea]|uniref:Integrase n=1 Tax=Nonomuraea roseoviolacea subsp. carminata TaxID=160689 RepID=A0ABT1KAF3_9ACTN|nr:site-specific integrase [Nonomuraea roseoviolacea]MCP2350572.1 integrase [Nonomuraea roseoviolacea subsp. carminata]
MPYIRRLPSGLYQATVRMPNGKRVTETNRLKSVVDKWARQQEAKFAAGDVRDPNAGKIKVSDWYARWTKARLVEGPTKAKNASLWATHCQPKWGDWPMQAVQRVDAQAWVGELIETRRVRHKGRAVSPFADQDEIPTLAASTIHDIVYLMGSMYRAAMKENPPVVLVNPFGDLDLPRRNAKSVEFYERAEAQALYAAVEELHGPGWRTLVELGMDVGLRPGELYGLHGHRVDWMRGLLAVVEVQTREGLRAYPKSMKSNRVVPVPALTLAGMSRLMQGRGRMERVFTAPGGGLIDDGNFRDRIWYPSIEEAGIRRFPPRIMRHTAASWLVQDGVPLYDVQSLLGHESFTTTQRYAHLAPDAHEKVVQSWRRRASGDAR